MPKVTLLAKYLKEHAISCQEAADALDVTKQYVSMLALGSVTPGLALAYRVEHWSRGAVPMQCWLR